MSSLLLLLPAALAQVPPPDGGPAGGAPPPAPPGAFEVAAPITVRLAVSNLTGTDDLSLRAMTRWGPEDRQLQLTDDGSTPGDLPQDGIWVGVWTGPPLELLPVTLVLERTAQPPATVYAAWERIQGPEDRLTWSLDLGTATGAAPAATRISAPYISRRLPEASATSMAASLGWLAVLGAWATWLLGRWRGAP